MVEKINDTSELLPLPTKLIDQVIGQEKAVRIARLAAHQHRHLLLVGPPGVGKSMIARAMAELLPPTRQQISVAHNPKRPERPKVIVEWRDDLRSSLDPLFPGEDIKVLDPSEVPFGIAYQLGFRCKRCGEISSRKEDICPHCGFRKYGSGPFGDLYPEKKRSSVNIKDNGKIYIYEAKGESILLTTYNAERFEKMMDNKRDKVEKKVIVPIDRPQFVEATAANETELLGDVEHDPYGGHPEIGIPHYKRVVPGAIHEAHEGVLFIDELSTLKPNVQRAILTAMQEKKFTITGRNPTGTGAAVKVEDVPADFILVGAINVTDLDYLHPALRSRIQGEGYEVVLNTWMEDTPENKLKLYQFVAQEIVKDKRIPHASRGALEEIHRIAKKIAKEVDEVDGITLRLRKLGGIIRAAGDIARLERSSFIEKDHIKEAYKINKSAEEQISEITKGNWWKDLSLDYSTKKVRDVGVR